MIITFEYPNYNIRYDDKEKIGWLCDYYPWGSLEQADWRHKTYSPEILNYKEGHDKDIKFFIPQMTFLIESIVINERISDSPVLIPAPTSTPKSDPDYKTTARIKGENHNRDNRNELFCKRIVSGKEGWFSFSLLSRIAKKTPKEIWNETQQFESMQLDDKYNSILKSGSPIFLVDDVTTHYSTFKGSIKHIRSVAPSAPVFCVAIGHTRSPDFFKGHL